VLQLDAEVEVELGKEEEGGGAAEARKVMHLPERERWQVLSRGLA